MINDNEDADEESEYQNHCSWSPDTRNLLVGFWHLEEKEGKNMLDNSTNESAESCGSTMLQS